MNREQLYDGVTEIRDDLVEEAVAPRRRKRPWGLLAACLALVLGIAWLAPNLGGSSGGSGGRTGTAYMYYTGPVFPLDILEEAGALSAARTTNFDFTPYESPVRSYLDAGGTLVTYESGCTEVLVTDAYTLTNPTDQPVTVTAVYPFAASLNSELRELPRITVDGQAADPDLWAGDCVAGGEGAWTDYEVLLADGTYQADALAGNLTLDQPVVVYEITSAAALEEASAPTLAFTAELPEGSLLLSYGSSGGQVDESGGSVRHFHIPAADERQESQCILILGQDLTGYTIQGYRDGGCEPGGEIETAVQTERYESTLGEMLARFYEENRGYGGGETILGQISSRTYLGLLGQSLERCGMTAMAELSDLFTQNTGGNRVFYLTFPVTVPAHGQTEVQAALHREAHRDYTGGGRDRDGYDLTTQLGSSLPFTQQRASLTNWAQIQILDQNFGFDPDRGVTEVTLDPAEAYYWMDVKKAG